MQYKVKPDELEPVSVNQVITFGTDAENSDLQEVGTLSAEMAGRLVTGCIHGIRDLSDLKFKSVKVRPQVSQPEHTRECEAYYRVRVVLAAPRIKATLAANLLYREVSLEFLINWMQFMEPPTKRPARSLIRKEFVAGVTKALRRHIQVLQETSYEWGNRCPA